jgi:hypothetical protein
LHQLQRAAIERLPLGLLVGVIRVAFVEVVLDLFEPTDRDAASLTRTNRLRSPGDKLPGR